MGLAPTVVTTRDEVLGRILGIEMDWSQLRTEVADHPEFDLDIVELIRDKGEAAQCAYLSAKAEGLTGPRLSELETEFQDIKKQYQTLLDVAAMFDSTVRCKKGVIEEYGKDTFGEPRYMKRSVAKWARKELGINLSDWENCGYIGETNLAETAIARRPLLAILVEIIEEYDEAVSMGTPHNKESLLAQLKLNHSADMSWYSETTYNAMYKIARSITK